MSRAEAIVGGYHGQLSYVVRDSGQWQLRGQMPTVPAPSFVLVDEQQPWLWVLNEGEQDSELLLYQLGSGWPLRLLARAKTQGQGPCALLSWQGRIYLCHYGSGQLEAMHFDGQQLSTQALWTATGQGACPERQASPHLHHLLPTPDGQALLAADLGSDSLHLLSPELQLLQSIACPAGSGPRSLLWQGHDLWVTYELSDQLARWRWQSGQLIPLDLVAAHDAAVGDSVDSSGHSAPRNYPSMALLLDDQLWLANRGLDRLDVFASQTAEHLFSRSLMGLFPRHMQAVPSLNDLELLIAQQLSHQLEVLAVNSGDHYCLAVNSPTMVCLLPEAFWL